MPQNQGWIKLHRKMLEWEWYDDSDTKSLFLHLLMTANRKPKEWRGLKLERGQVVTGRKALSEILGISEQKIRTCMKRLKSTNEITSKSTNKFTVITVINYDTYQGADEPSNQQINQNSNQQSTNNQPATNQQSTTNKKLKKLKKEETGENKDGFINKPCPIQKSAEAILNYLNKKIGSNYRASSAKNQALIRARFNQGFTLKDFQTVIDKKTAEWLGDEKFSKFLRPETLFGTKFESYLNQVAAVRALPIFSDAGSKTYENGLRAKQNMFGGGA